MIKLLIVDFDGVLTSGNKYYNTSGEVVMKEFNDRDWTAIKRFKSCGVKVVALSGDRNINEAVCKNRNLEFYCSRSDKGLNKTRFIPKFTKKYKIKPIDMAYIGDDLFDSDIMKKVGYCFCPSDAISDLKALPGVFVLSVAGGNGVLASLLETCRGFNFIPPDNINKIIDLDNREK
jgi:3-deoxy-D-manno-octulosonate 8-phosphate phosphatase (KDO 8-P phosphatase)